MRRALAMFLVSLEVEHPSSKTVSNNYMQLLDAIGRTDAEIQAERAAMLKG
jgi:hypothetical protein